MARLPNVRLDLLNRPENVLLVRETLTGVAEAIGLDGPDLSDVRTAVTEACNNVVLHAYAGGEGPLQVEVCLGDHLLDVLVRDQGVGIHRTGAPEAEDTGLGVPVIEALTEDVDFGALPDGTGTTVNMRFATPSARTLPPASANGRDDLTTPDATGLDERKRGAMTAISVAPTELARTVVPRLLCVLAARAHFSTDRISDSQLIGDALVAHADGAITGDYLQLAVSVEPRDLELRVGPLHAGRGERLVRDSDVEGLGPLLEKLADRHDVRRSDSHDTLTLQLLDRA
jgi:serine/threonine-protein kinase RsbW